MTIYTLKPQSKYKEEKKDFLEKIAEIFDRIETFTNKHQIITSILFFLFLGKILYIGMAIDASSRHFA